MGRAVSTAGYQCLLTGQIAAEQPLHVHQSTGRTDFDAGGAEPALGLVQRQVVGSRDISLHALLLIVDGANLTQAAAGTDAAAALDAAVILTDDNRSAGANFQGGLLGELVLHAGMENAQILPHCLKLAVAIGTAAGAVVGMAGHDELQRNLTQLGQLLRLGMYLHTFLNFSNAGGYRCLLPVDLHHAHLTSTGGRQIGMGTQMRDIDARGQRGFQYAHALFGLDFGAIYKQRNFAHLLKLPYIDCCIAPGNTQDSLPPPGRRFLVYCITLHSAIQPFFHVSLTGNSAKFRVFYGLLKLIGDFCLLGFPTLSPFFDPSSQNHPAGKGPDHHPQCNLSRNSTRSSIRSAREKPRRTDASPLRGCFPLPLTH